MTDYIVCIPSYKRAQLCKDKTLAMLHKNKIDSTKIYVYVANKEEYDIYIKILDKSLYHKLIVGVKGLVPQREFIMNSWTQGKRIVFMDDDIESIDMSLSKLFKGHSLHHFFKTAFDDCAKEGAYIWGIYPVFNPFFRKGRKEITRDLNFIVGAFYGIVNRPALKSIKLTITKEDSQKEDTERTLKYFIEDGIVLRYNRIGFVTKFYGKEGGLGRFEERIKSGIAASKRLIAAFPEYGKVRTRKNGMPEFIIKKIPTTKNVGSSQTAKKTRKQSSKSKTQKNRS